MPWAWVFSVNFITMSVIDIIVPVKNEEKNIKDMVLSIEQALAPSNIEYRIIFVVDQSTDKTIENIKKMQDSHPVILHEKQGKGGKGYSILEGLDLVTADFVAFIDGDLQYHPKHLPEMVKKLQENAKTGVVIAQRKTQNLSRERAVLSKVNAFIVGKMLLGMDVDIQSGLKIFRKEIINHINRKLVTPWTFDIPLLEAARELGYTFDSVTITFSDRQHGASKVGIIKTSYAIIMCALKVKLSPKKIYELDGPNTFEKGIIYKKKAYLTHSHLPHKESAIYTFVRSQKIAFGLVGIGLIAAIIYNPFLCALIFIAILSTIYFLDVLFNVYVILKSLHFPPEFTFEKDEIAAIDDKTLPLYTVLCPLYKESEVLPFFAEHIEALNWPKDKLEVLLLLEANDLETIETAKSITLPSYFKIVVVPHSMPKTKPKACNYGLLRANGEYVVIYDAEDKPDPDQLKKAYLAFTKLGEKTVCVQAKLNYFNANHNLLTRFFTAEYSLWFDVILPGLQSINTIIPLGGTSNHFITKKLRELQGWDPFNVTEDCDLGSRLFKLGYTTAIIDSTTLEEANSNTRNWIRQRSRWIKGYMQTYLVHMRNPAKFFKAHGKHAFVFQLIIGLRISFILINPFLWLTTISYFVFYNQLAPFIESLFPTVVFYMAAISLIFGNFIYLYNYMIGCAKRGHWGLMKFVFLVPFYWILMFFAAVMAFYQLIFNPHHWEKTNHGLHLIQKKRFSLFKKNNKDKPKNDTNIEPEKLTVTTNTKEEKKIKVLALAINKLNKNGEFILIIALLASNALNYLCNAYLSRVLTIEDFGLISLFNNFLFVASLFFSSLSLTVAYESGYSLGKFDQIIGRFWRYARKKFFGISTIFAITWLIATPFIISFFNESSVVPFIIFAPIWIIGALSSIDYGYINGVHKFKLLSIVIVSEPIAKLALTYLLNTYISKDSVYYAIPLSMIVALIIGYVFACRIKTDKQIENSNIILKFPTEFFLSGVIYRFSVIAFISIDIILAKHYLSPSDAGYYALISLVGKMIFFLSSLAGQFLVPFISKSEGEQADSSQRFYWIFGFTAIIGFFSYLFFGYFGNITAPILLGQKIVPVTYLLPEYALAILFFTLSSCVIGFHQIRKNYITPIISFVIAMAQITALSIFGTNLQTFINTIFILSILNLGVTFVVHYYEKNILTIWLNIKDFIDLFSELPSDHIENKNKRVLILNWRDTKHTWAGGAEAYVHEIAKSLKKQGMSIVIFCGNDQKSKRRETIDGIYIIRRGGQFTVYIWSFIYYFFRFRGKFDVVIDSENGIPFFSPIYADAPVIGLVHHVHREIILKELDLALHLKAIAYVARFLESNIMPIVYKNCKMITVSDSTKKDMIKIGLGKNQAIEIIHPGAESSKFYTSKKTEHPSLLYLGRIKSYKSIEVVIHAIDKLKKEIPNIELNIAGFGDHTPHLQKIVEKLKLEKHIKFLGKVTEEEKIQLMSAAWIFVYPSIWEGWGISVIEANACGTPVLASNVPGLKDSVKHEYSGYLVKYGSVNDFTKRIKQIIENPELLNNLQNNSLAWSKNFTWDGSALKLIPILELEIAKNIKNKNYLTNFTSLLFNKAETSTQQK